MPPPSPSSDQVVHRALASSTRRTLLEVLRHADDATDAEALASELDLHVTTVRGHLTLLEQAGLVTSTTVRSGRPGRPTTVYLATSRPPTPNRTAGYRLLAEVLVDGLASAPPTPDSSQWAHDVGARWGPRLIDRMGLRGTGSPTEIMHASFDAMGFEPETTPDDVRLHACPFADLAMGNEAIVCDLHLGMARGMLDDLDADVVADDLVPFAAPSLCVLSLGGR
jgi:predicted ArsR family transcriptional regulator